MRVKLIKERFFEKAMEDIVEACPRVHVFVCVNDRSGRTGEVMPSCGPRIKPDDVKAVKEWVRNLGLVREVFVTKAQCLGFCHASGGVMCVYPQGRFVRGLQGVEDIKKVISEELRRGE